MNENIDLLTFKEFAKRIPRKECDNLTYQFNTLIENGDFSKDDTESTYLRVAIRLLEGTEDQILKANLIGQSSVKNIFVRNLKEMLEDAVVDSLMEFRIPKYAVRVSRRMWLIANPDDFSIVRNGNSVGLVCYARSRTKLYIVERATEDEMVKGVRDLIKDLPLTVSDEAIRNCLRGYKNDT